MDNITSKILSFLPKSPCINSEGQIESKWLRMRRNIKLSKQQQKTLKSQNVW